jgi:hypothetical protein
MKITAKTTKEQLVKALGVNSKAVKEADKNLYDRMVYTSNAMKKDAKSVTKSDLVELVRDTIKSLGDKFIEPALAEEKTETKVETSVETKETKTEKKAPAKESSLKSKVKSKKNKEVAEATESEVASEQSAEETKEEAVKSAKKTGAEKPVKKTQKGEAVEVLEESKKQLQQRAKKFPAKIDVQGESYEVAMDITSMDKLYDAVNADEDILLAFYYPKRNIKQFGYFNNILGTPKSFENDLDLASVLYISEEKKVAYAISVYMEAPYTIMPEDFEIVDDVRISGFNEFEIYRKVESK